MISEPSRTTYRVRLEYFRVDECRNKRNESTNLIANPFRFVLFRSSYVWHYQ